MKDFSPGLELAWKLTFPHEAKCPTAGLHIHRLAKSLAWAWRHGPL